MSRRMEFEGAYRQHVHAVFAYAVQCVGRREIAEEITGDVFLKLFEHWSEVDKQRLPAWLFTVARNVASDYWRRNVVRARYQRQNAVSEVQPPAQDSDAVERWILSQAGLKPAHRTCLLLRYLHGLDRQEIARRIGLSENQVKSNLQYALKLMRKAYATESV